MTTSRKIALLAGALAITSFGIASAQTPDTRIIVHGAINAPAQYSVFTLDLPPDAAPKFGLAPGERAYVEKPRSGRRFLEAAPEWGTAAARISDVKIGNAISAGESLGTVFCSDEAKAKEAVKAIQTAYEVRDNPVQELTLVKEVINE